MKEDTATAELTELVATCEESARRFGRALRVERDAAEKLKESHGRIIEDMKALRHQLAMKEWLAKAEALGMELDPEVEVVSGPAHPLSEYKPMAEVGRMIAGKRIVEARKKVGLSQAALGKKVGMPQSQISRIERNPERCTVRTLRKLAKALKVDVATFLQE